MCVYEWNLLGVLREAVFIGKCVQVPKYGPVRKRNSVYLAPVSAGPDKKTTYSSIVLPYAGCEQVKTLCHVCKLNRVCGAVSPLPRLVRCRQSGRELGLRASSSFFMELSSTRG